MNDYHHPKWQKKRLKILERDEYECRCCADTESKLNIHHFYYQRELKIWNYPDEHLITVCDKCHDKLHEFKIRLFKLIAKAGRWELDSVINANDNELADMIKLPYTWRLQRTIDEEEWNKDG